MEPGDPLKRNKGPRLHHRASQAATAAATLRGSAAQIAGSVGRMARGRFSGPSTPSTTAGPHLDGIDIAGDGEQETPTRPWQDDDDDYNNHNRHEPPGTTTSPHPWAQRGTANHGPRGRNDRGHGQHSEHWPKGTPAACGAGLRPVPRKEEQVRRAVSMYILQRYGGRRNSREHRYFQFPSLPDPADPPPSRPQRRMRVPGPRSQPAALHARVRTLPRIPMPGISGLEQVLTRAPPCHPDMSSISRTL